METLSAPSNAVPPSLTTMNVNAGIMPRRASANYDNQVFTAAPTTRVSVIYGDSENPARVGDYVLRSALFPHEIHDSSRRQSALYALQAFGHASFHQEI
jgi:hypothetical protein